MGGFLGGKPQSGHQEEKTAGFLPIRGEEGFLPKWGEGFFIQSPSILGNYVSSRLKRFRSKTFLLHVKIADFYSI